MNSLSLLKMEHIAELKTYKNPPNKVLMVLSALMILLRLEPDWNTIKKCICNFFLQNSFKFLIKS